MGSRGRLVVVSLIGLAVGVLGGVLVGRIITDDADPELVGDVVLDEPGEYQQPLDDGATDPVGAIDPDGARLPDVELEDAGGTRISSASLVGDPLVVNVWYSTCPPCERELADFAEVHAEVGDAVRFVGINPIDGVATMESFAADRGVGYELLRDPAGRFVDAVELVSYPLTLFVAPDGTVLERTGELDADRLRATIEELFAT